MKLEIDHIVLCVLDLDVAAEVFRSRFGLPALRGGRHPGHGTENLIVPLGQSYLELVGVVDHAEAAESPFGQWVAHLAGDELMPHALCLRAENLDGLCEALGLTASPMSRVRPDGVNLRWRLAGLEEMITRGLPFYIEWQVPPELHPGRDLDRGAARSAHVEVWLEGDQGLLESRIGASPGVHVGPGPAAVVRASIRIAGKDIVLGRSMEDPLLAY